MENTDAKSNNTWPVKTGQFESGKGVLAFTAIGEIQQAGVTSNVIFSAAACGAVIDVLGLLNQSSGTPSVVVEYRGRGGSPALSPGDHSIPAYAQDVLSAYTHFGVKTASVLGYSHNAEVAVHLALSEPERVESLILIEPGLFVDREVFEKRIRLFEAGDVDGALRETFNYASPTMSDEDLDAAVASAKKYYGEDYAGLLGEYKARAAYSISEESLSQIKAPTMIIGGARSNIRTQIFRTARSIPNASVVWSQGANHYLNGCAPAMAKVIESFRALNAACA